MKSLFSITDFMPSEAKCVKVLRELRWPGGRRCPRCNSRQTVKFSPVRKAMHRYICKKCHRTFTDLTGTVFERTKLDLNEWFYIARELQRGISINQISKELGRKYEHVMHAAHKIMGDVFMKRLIELSGEDIEVDEMYQSVGYKGTKQTEREPRKRGLKLKGRGTYDKDKPPIVAAVSRKGKAVIEVFRNLCIDNIDAFLYLVTGRFVHTDDYRIYDHLDHETSIIHESINHSKRRYKEGYKHTNTVEGLFCDLRNWLRRYKGVCKEKLYMFVSLFQFSYNHRELFPLDKFIELLSTFIRT
jgi:transposase-like protein/IS1 family transposase